jgi:hypothetical protein
MEKDIPSNKYPFIDSIITRGVTVFARAICRINNTTIRSKNKMLERKETWFNIDRFSNSDNHSIMITINAMLKILERYLVRASADSKKIRVKQILYKILCHSIGKKGIKNIVKITKSNKTELLLVKNPADTSL